VAAKKAPAGKAPAKAAAKAAAESAIKKAGAKKTTLKAAKPKVSAAAKKAAAARAQLKQTVPLAPFKPDQNRAPLTVVAPPKPAFDYQSYLQDLDRLGIKLGLGRIEKLLKALGSPEKKLSVVHVVGTNGKSSTSRMISAILGGHGLKAGTYLSPHLVSFNERFMVNGNEITDLKLEKLLLEVKNAAEEVNKRSRSSGPLTQFEILTAAAFLYFHQQKVDVAVVEAGLGGRYDATNVVHSKVQVFTNAELEHTDLLGQTIEEIVREKTAVIPEKSHVVLGAMSEKALAEAVKICKRKKSKMCIFGEEYSLLRGRGDMFDVWTEKSQYADLWLTLFGQYQRTNCAVAIQAAELFLKKPLDEKKLRRVLPTIKIPGRLEVISEKPMIILDGAHNPSGIDELLHSLSSVVEAKRVICVVSVLKDKDAEAMLRKLLDFCDILFITENSNPRCAKAQDLAKLPVIDESHVQTFVARENQSALESAFKLASIRDVILVTGSLYLLADIKRRML
jgi:dihydrofolate synthase/folylpolyglutamate synthase